MFGSGGKIYPDYLMDSTDVVFVSINYRLGVLGNAIFNLINGNWPLRSKPIYTYTYTYLMFTFEIFQDFLALVMR